MSTSESILEVFGQAIAFRDALRDLIRTLPLCSKCHQPATRGLVVAYRERFCDEHGGDLDEYTYAGPLRRALALLRNDP